MLTDSPNLYQSETTLFFYSLDVSDKPLSLKGRRQEPTAVDSLITSDRKLARTVHLLFIMHFIVAVHCQAGAVTVAILCSSLYSLDLLNHPGYYSGILCNYLQ